MHPNTSRLSIGALALLASGSCTCELTLGPGVKGDSPAPTASAPPVLTQRSSAIDPTQPPSVPVPPAPAAAEPTGVLSEASVRKTEARHRNELRFCFKQEEPAKGDAPELRVQFVVKPDGLVADEVEVVGRSDVSAKLESCLVRALKRWKFEAPEGGPARATLRLTER